MKALKWKRTTFGYETNNKVVCAHIYREKSIVIGATRGGCSTKVAL